MPSPARWVRPRHNTAATFSDQKSCPLSSATSTSSRSCRKTSPPRMARAKVGGGSSCDIKTGGASYEFFFTHAGSQSILKDSETDRLESAFKLVATLDGLNGPWSKVDDKRKKLTMRHKQTTFTPFYIVAAKLNRPWPCRAPTLFNNILMTCLISANTGN